MLNEAKIKDIIARVFGVDVSAIDAGSSPETIKKWDSLGHMNLVSALEEELCIQFEDEEIDDMMNVGLILAITGDKLQ